MGLHRTSGGELKARIGGAGTIGPMSDRESSPRAPSPQPSAPGRRSRWCSAAGASRATLPLRGAGRPRGAGVRPPHSRTGDRHVGRRHRRGPPAGRGPGRDVPGPAGGWRGRSGRDGPDPAAGRTVPQGHPPGVDRAGVAGSGHRRAAQGPRPAADPAGRRAPAPGPARVRPGQRPLANLLGDDWPSRPLWIPATDLASGRRVVFGRDLHPPVHRAVAASAALPGFFAPARVDERVYVDGGIASPFNLDLILEDRDEGAEPGPIAPTIW